MQQKYINKKSAIFIVALAFLGTILLLIANSIKTNQTDINSILLAALQNHVVKNSHYDETSTFKIMYEQLLDNPNDKILEYINLPYEYSYGSNSIPLVVSALLTEGDLLELGMGMYSTPLLHKLAVSKRAQAVSIDTKLEWANHFTFYNLTNNHLVYAMDYKDMNLFGLDKMWGLVLVDHGQADTRHINIHNFANISQIVIAHDAEDTSEHMYKYEKNRIRPLFKYSSRFSVFHQDKSTYTGTLILSNFIDVNKFHAIFNKIKTDYGFKLD